MQLGSCLKGYNDPSPAPPPVLQTLPVFGFNKSVWSSLERVDFTVLWTESGRGRKRNLGDHIFRMKIPNHFNTF